MNKTNNKQAINTFFLIILLCSFSLHFAKKLSNKSTLSTKIKQMFNTNSMISYDSSISKLEKLDVNISCAKGALTGFKNVVNTPVDMKKITHSFSYGCTSGSSSDIFNSSSPATKGLSSSLVEMIVPKKGGNGTNPAPIGNSCSCEQGQVMQSLEFYTDEKLKNHISLRCTCVPIKENSQYECKQKENTPILLDPNRCPIYGYRLYFHMTKLPIDLKPGVLKSLTLGFNDKSINCSDKICDNLLVMNFEYCYPKGQAPLSVDLFQTAARPTNVIDPKTVPYESELGPNVTDMSANGFNKNSFSKIFFDNDKEKLPEKINASFGCKGEGALRGFDLSTRKDVKFKWGSYYSFNYGCTKGDQKDFVDASASEIKGESATGVMVQVPKKDGSGNINQSIANSCTCPEGSVMKSIDFSTNVDAKNPYVINCSCVAAKKTLQCEKKRLNPIDLKSMCPVLGFGIYGKLKLNISEGLNRALKSFTFGYNERSIRCNEEFCQNLVVFEYEFCYEPGTNKIEAAPFGPIVNPESALANNFNSPKTSTFTAPSSTYTYTAPKSTSTFTAPSSTYTYTAPKSTSTFTAPSSTYTYTAPKSTSTFTAPSSTYTYTAPKSTSTFTAPSMNNPFVPTKTTTSTAPSMNNPFAPIKTTTPTAPKVSNPFAPIKTTYAIPQPFPENTFKDMQSILDSLNKQPSNSQSNTIIVKDPNDLQKIINARQQSTNIINTPTSTPSPQQRTTTATSQPISVSSNLRVQSSATVTPTPIRTPTPAAPATPTATAPIATPSNVVPAPTVNTNTGSFLNPTTTSEPAAPSNGNSVSANDIETIIRVHNTLRNQLATQTTEFGVAYPKAVNMRQMYWSDEIAKLAQIHADKKVFGHSTSSFRKSSQFSYLGENLYTSSTSSTVLNPNWERAVRAWYDEIKDYNKLAQDVSKFVNVDSAMIGHFTQVVWAETYQVGCGISTYPREKNGMQLTTNLLVCIYGPGGNKLNSSLYISSDSGRQCSNGTTNSNGYEGLCCVPNKCSANDFYLN